MARYDPIYQAAFDLAVHLEQIVRHFDRYHKYTLGTDLRTGSRRVLERIIEANESRERRPVPRTAVAGPGATEGAGPALPRVGPLPEHARIPTRFTRRA